MARTQELANQAVVLDSINDSRLNYVTALFYTAMGVAVVIVQKRMDQRQPYSKVSDSQESEPTTGANLYRSL